ncbi:hypothetical protein M9H77_34510 [Catharanthus roseus]|uniref:Uncharacterized protein n=1 Tax=Catharanthus roseus TaxID=4058 RepID=A0ACB9ZPZ6_CATRO|nr:hypothetical protein M9H77_34510 [Catharanthus roseus]
MRQTWEQTCHEEKDTRYASGRSCRHFSLSEIISATQNFSDAFLIGRGGFGNVYKGVLHRSSEIVAVKRLKSNSKQGAHEFWTEIETLSKIRHTHLVSLIGYCNEYREMILVYEYMPHGTLADNLYKLGRNGKDCTPLTWEQRLRICIGAARGLDYLHTGVEFGVIHRDLQHRNIVRLLGNCIEGEENMLIYEFVPNKSLEGFLFEQNNCATPNNLIGYHSTDLEKQPMLNWSKRQKIIEGIARGLLYLHDESQVRIIHRDLNANNVLLDANMNPKIADFGLARSWQGDQSEVETLRIVGTYGYMCPEYALHGRYSVKSDVYSFGILVLEIICGRRNLFYNLDGIAQELKRYAWRKWMEETPLALLDPAAGDSYDENEVIRYVQVGLLCVQDDARQRPNMASVLRMLLNSSVTLPAPQQPGQVYHLMETPTSRDGKWTSWAGFKRICCYLWKTWKVGMVLFCCAYTSMIFPLNFSLSLTTEKG